jgi:AraC family transcriptional regulator, transcriptional activator of pobA
MANTQPFRIKSITEYHRVTGLPKPEHPLISVVNMASIHLPASTEPVSLVFDFYSISLKRNSNVKFKYGQQQYDFDEGVMFFISPGQVFGVEVEEGKEMVRSGWLLLVHPDFLWNTPLAKTIKQYEYFSYSVHEALFLSDKEETMITGIMQNVAQEYHSNIDKFSQNVIIAQLELLLTYAERFYQRQFITRKITNHQILDRVEDFLNSYFAGDLVAKKGLPSVLDIAAALNVTPTYLSGLLKVLTGQSTQQHIHDKLIEKAKEKLSTTSLSVSEIAYELGFEHPQSFSKLFKNKMKVTPLEFRHSFN